MERFEFLELAFVSTAAAERSTCFEYAVSELKRLLGRLGITCEDFGNAKRGDGFVVRVAEREGKKRVPPAVGGVRGDGFILRVSRDELVVAAPTAKGILNGVYDLAERLGFVFILPGAAGEWAPERRRIFSVPVGTYRVEPRFAHRGVFWQPLKTQDFSVGEWLRFYAKLRFNAISREIEDLDLAEQLGLRLEVGGHGLSKLLPRDLFGQDPEMFRMAQPEDFGGRRTPDSNLCATNARTRMMLKEAYAALCRKKAGAYAVHAWPDDLPGGGWCLCPGCRAFSPSDQALLAMRHLAESVREHGLPVRVPLIAYHDTLFPGRNVRPPADAFLLFAPRERCYGHRLDDPACARNGLYLRALRAWMDWCKDLDDAHAFEYYFDQILFRGMYPFLPHVIVGDAKTYEAHGIESLMALQVGGPAIAPDYNMLAFARVAWDRRVSVRGIIDGLAHRIHPARPGPWRDYLTARAAAFEDALRICEHDTTIYLDYRWLPEDAGPFAERMAESYSSASAALVVAAARLEKTVAEQAPDAVRALAAREGARARFEAAELAVMRHQQSAVTRFARHQGAGDRESLRQGIQDMEKALVAIEAARERAREAGLPESSWYYGNINAWLKREFSWKLTRYRKFV